MQNDKIGKIQIFRFILAKTISQGRAGQTWRLRLFGVPCVCRGMQIIEIAGKQTRSKGLSQEIAAFALAM